jgi:hypothetical protein
MSRPLGMMKLTGLDGRKVLFPAEMIGIVYEMPESEGEVEHSLITFREPCHFLQIKAIETLDEIAGQYAALVAGAAHLESR